MGVRLASDRQRIPPQGLDEYVIGQQDVKKALSVAVHTHYLRLYSKEKARHEQVGGRGWVRAWVKGLGACALGRPGATGGRHLHCVYVF